jgi:hypothetical protein
MAAPPQQASTEFVEMCVFSTTKNGRSGPTGIHVGPKCNKNKIAATNKNKMSTEFVKNVCVFFVQLRMAPPQQVSTWGQIAIKTKWRLQTKTKCRLNL